MLQAQAVPIRGVTRDALWQPPRLIVGSDKDSSQSRCAFITGGPRQNLPGTACVVQQLRALNTRHAVVVAAPSEDVEHIRQRLKGHNVSSFLSWSRFPHRFPGTNWARSNVMDKLNVLASPFARVVWLDPDMYVSRSIDSLCELNVSFAAAINSGVASETCWAPPDPALSKSRGRPAFAESSWLCHDCAHREVVRPHARGGRHTSRGLPPCRYMLNSGVMSLRPLRSAAEFRRLVLEPTQRGVAWSREGSDQGALNSLINAHHLFGSDVRILSPAFNRLARVYAQRPDQWKDPAVVHFSGETKPWRGVGDRDTAAHSLRRRIRPLLDRWDHSCAAYRDLAIETLGKKALP